MRIFAWQRGRMPPASELGYARGGFPVLLGDVDEEDPLPAPPTAAGGFGREPATPEAPGSAGAPGGGRISARGVGILEGVLNLVVNVGRQLVAGAAPVIGPAVARAIPVVRLARPAEREPLVPAVELGDPAAADFAPTAERIGYDPRGLQLNIEGSRAVGTVQTVAGPREVSTELAFPDVGLGEDGAETLEPPQDLGGGGRTELV